MGTGYHGGFGHTLRASDKAVSLSPSYTGDDADLGKAAKWLKPKDGYTDIVIHGLQDSVQIKRGDKWITLDHRRLAKMYKHDKELSKKPVRLVSCYTGEKLMALRRTSPINLERPYWHRLTKSGYTRAAK